MDLFDVVRSCLRRWYIVLPLLLLVAWYSYGIYNSTKPVYYSNAVIGVSPPSSRIDTAQAGQPVARNGLLDIGGAGLITNMTAIGLRDSSVVSQVVADGGSPDYISRMFPVPATSPELPLIMIEATEPDPISASKTVTSVVAQADSALRLLQQQAKVPPDQMVTSFVVSPPSPPAAGMPSRTRSTISVFVAGAGLTVVLTVLFDVLLLRWKGRRPKLAQKTAADGPDPAATEPTKESPSTPSEHEKDAHNSTGEVPMESR